MTAAAMPVFWGSSGVPEWWPKSAEEAAKVQELIEHQVAATTQLTGQVGRLEGQMEAVRRQLDSHDSTTRKLQETLDRLLAQVSTIEAEKRSAAVAVKVAWAVVIAAGGLLAWIVSSFGITIGMKK